jgi:hypothetical protein
MATALTVHAEVDDGGTLSYRWYRSETDSNEDGTAIPDETEASYTPPTDTVSIVYYYVEVTNTITDNGDGGNKTATAHSHTARIEVNEKVNAAVPHIATHPQGVEYTYGDTAEALTVSVEVNHDGTLSYQWYCNEINSDEGGTEIPGATEESYTPTVGNAGEAHYYYVVVTNTIADNGDGGNKIALICSDPAEVTVKPRPLTVSVPSGTVLTPLENETFVTFTVNGLIGSDTATVSATNLPTGLTRSGNTITYNGTTAFANPSVTLNFSVNASSNYTTPTATSAITVCDGQADYTGATGTYDRRIPVRQANIAAFNAYANTTNGLTRHYKLTGNITLSGTNNWTAIGTSSNAFTGTFNGQGYTIASLNINNDQYYQGMFGLIGTGGVVQNLGLVNAYVTGRINVGGVVGYNNGTVQKCYVTGSISSSLGSVGGVVGYNGSYGASGAVQNCYATGSINGSDLAVGGVVGVSYNSVVENCYATGNVNGSHNYASGVVGGNFPGSTVRNCVALNLSVKITYASSTAPARVVGNTEGTRINNRARIDMVVQYNQDGSTDTNKTLTKGTTEVDGADVAAGTGTGQYNNQSFWSSTMGWDFTNVWQWNSTTNLPVLRGFNQAQNQSVP